MALPPMTPETRARALDRAKEVRTARAELKRKLKGKEITLADALGQECAVKMKVSSVLQSLPGIGPVSAEQVMTRLKIADNRRVGGLGSNQRAELAAMFAPIDA